MGDDRFGSISATERDARRRLVLLPNRTPIRDRSACVGACWPFSPTRRMTMQDNEASVAASLRRGPWNKGKLVGAKPPLRPKHVWSIRTKLQLADRKRDLALFNLAIDSKLRGCDVVALKVEDIAPHGYALDRATVRQKKTGRPVRFELTEQTRQALDDYLSLRGRRAGDILFAGRRDRGSGLTTRQYARPVSTWLTSIALSQHTLGSLSMLRTT